MIKGNRYGNTFILAFPDAAEDDYLDALIVTRLAWKLPDWSSVRMTRFVRPNKPIMRMRQNE